jgi:hypothetical protein
MYVRSWLLIVAAAAGCKHEPAPPVPPPAPTPVAKLVDAAPLPADDPPPDAWEARYSQEAIDHAFGGSDNMPKVPAITPDGKRIAIDLGYSHGMGYWHTYEWGIYGRAGALEDRITLMDEKQADSEPTPSQAALAPLVKQLRDKLAGFQPMHEAPRPELDEHGKGKVTLGGGTFAIDDTQGLDVVWTPRVGPPKKMHADGGPHCGGAPKLAGLWFDETHGRLVYEVTFMGRDSCPDDAPQWHVF